MTYPMQADVWREGAPSSGSRFGMPTPGALAYSHTIQCALIPVMSSIRVSADAPVVEYTLLVGRSTDIAPSDQIRSVRWKDGSAYIDTGIGSVEDVVDYRWVKQGKVNFVGDN